VHTVDSIKNKKTVKEYSDARKVQSIQDMMGRPSTKDYIIYVENNMLLNCPKHKSGHYMHRRHPGTKFGILKG